MEGGGLHCSRPAAATAALHCCPSLQFDAARARHSHGGRRVNAGSIAEGLDATSGCSCSLWLLRGLQGGEGGGIEMDYGRRWGGVRRRRCNGGCAAVCSRSGAVRRLLQRARFCRCRAVLRMFVSG